MLVISKGTLSATSPTMVHVQRTVWTVFKRSEGSFVLAMCTLSCEPSCCALQKEPAVVH